MYTLIVVSSMAIANGTLQTGGSGGPYLTVAACQDQVDALWRNNLLWQNGKIKVTFRCISADGQETTLSPT